MPFASGHTMLNTPDPIRTRKLSGIRPGQYWGGGPPGKPFGCCWLFYIYVFAFRYYEMKRDCAMTWIFFYLDLISFKLNIQAAYGRMIFILYRSRNYIILRSHTIETKRKHFLPKMASLGIEPVQQKWKGCVSASPRGVP